MRIHIHACACILWFGVNRHPPGVSGNQSIGGSRIVNERPVIVGMWKCNREGPAVCLKWFIVVFDSRDEWQSATGEEERGGD